MIIKTEMSSVIKEFLERELITNLNILGIIENVPSAEIYVDDVDRPTGVLVRDGYFNYIYSSEDKFIDETMSSELFKEEGFYGFSGVENSIAEKIKKKFQQNWETNSTLFYMPKENLNMSLITNPARSIDIKDAETIDNFYTYRNENSLNAIKSDITKRPSSAIYVDGEIACWVLVHNDNTMGIMYTKEEHRRKGYAVDVTNDLASKIIEMGKIPFIHIVKQNNMSPGLAKKCGFVPHGNVSWFGIVVGTPKGIVEFGQKGTKEIINTLSENEKKFFYPENVTYNDLHTFLIKLNVDYRKISNFRLEEVKDLDMTYTWFKLLCRGYEVPEKELENLKKDLLDAKFSEEPKLKLYIGYVDEDPVSTLALYKIDNGAYSICYVSVLPKFRNRGIAKETIAESLKQCINNEYEIVFASVPENYTELFTNLGYKIGEEGVKY